VQVIESPQQKVDRLRARRHTIADKKANPPDLTAPANITARRAQLQQQLRDTVITEMGMDYADQPSTSPHVIAAMRGEKSPGHLVSLEGALKAAEEAPEGHPAKLVLHNLRELEKNPRGTKFQTFNTSDLQPGERVQINPKEIVTWEPEEGPHGTLRDGVTAEVPEGGTQVVGVKKLPPLSFYEAESPKQTGVFGQTEVLKDTGKQQGFQFETERKTLERPTGDTEGDAKMREQYRDVEATAPMFGPGAAENIAKSQRAAAATPEPSEGESQNAYVRRRVAEARQVAKNIDPGQRQQYVEQVKNEATETWKARNPLRPRGAVPLPQILEAVGHSVREVRDKITSEAVPKHQRNAPAAVDAAFAHAGARGAVPSMIDDLLARVAPDTYRDEKALHPLIDTLNKNDVLGGYDTFLKSSAQATAKATKLAADMKAARKQLKDLNTSPPAGVSPRDVGKLKQQAIRDFKKARSERTDALREATANSKAAANVTAKHDLSQYDADVQKAMADPKLRKQLENWKKEVQPELDRLFNEYRRVPANTPRQGRGRYMDTRINLLTADKAAEMAKLLKDPTSTFPAPGGSSYRNPDIKFDPTQLAAKFTGDYSTDPRLVLANVLGRRWQEVTKQRYTDSLTRSGVAVEEPSMQERQKLAKAGTPWQQPKQIQGQPAVRLPIKMSEAGKDSATRSDRAIWIRSDMVREARGVYGTDMPTSPAPFTKMLTGLQLMQLADATSHAANLGTAVQAAQGAGKPWVDAVRQIPD
jgi:hypothetical protein